MKKIVILLALICSLLFLEGCGSIYNPLDSKKMMQLEIGLTKDQVSNIFGTPGYRGVSDGKEKWEYKFIELDGHSFVTVWFEDNLVASFDSTFIPVNTNNNSRSFNNE